MKISGQFGEVNKAHLLKNISGQTHSTIVAAKMIKGELVVLLFCIQQLGNIIEVPYALCALNKMEKCIR